MHAKKVSGGGGAPSCAAGLSALPVATNRQGRWHDGVRGEALVPPALVRDTFSLSRARAYFALLCAFVLVVGLVCVVGRVSNRLSAIEGRLSALPLKSVVDVYELE